MLRSREHTLHRLNVPVERPAGKLRITFLSRSTDARRILNEDELVDALSRIDDIEVMKVDFNFRMDFLKQISVSCETPSVSYTPFRLFSGSHRSF